QEGSPWEQDRIVPAALKRLNDFAGHRPVAILETRPRGEPYEHERVRPIPLYLRGAGVSWGRYRALLAKALEILTATPADILPDLLDELALDPRAYDHLHPVNRRPNYLFGEWDPEHLDSQSRYRRFVVRQILLDALLARVEQGGPEHDEGLFEAAAVLSGTMLMASGVSGGSPHAHDSSTTLTAVVPRIARYREAFYRQLLDKVTGAHGEQLRQEAEALRQPFGGARQHLNQYLAEHRARQLQQRHLALLLAAMGFPEASRRQAAKIPAASARMMCEIQIRLTQGHLLIERGRCAE